MKVRLILPALSEAQPRGWQPVKYSLFPPLGLATLAGYLHETDEVVIEDEHVAPLDLAAEADVVGIEVYITNAHRAYALAAHYRRRGAHVVLGGLHPTSLYGEALAQADTVCLGPGEDPWPRFLEDFRAGHPRRLYRSRQRSLVGTPPIRRDLIRSALYLVPNSLVVSRGCPHACDFCYQRSFFAGGRSFYTQTVDAALEEISRLPGRHLYFLDDHLFGHRRFILELLAGMQGLGRVWQAAGTLDAVLQSGLMERAAASGLRSLFIGFESLNAENLRSQGKWHNRLETYSRAVKRLQDLGVMINASFIFGLDEDDPAVFSRTVEWAIGQGLETATFHILTPYPGTVWFERLAAQGRLLHRDWSRYDTRHAVFRPARLSPEQLEAGYWSAYREFYRWSAVWRAAGVKASWPDRLRHLAYAGGWKKLKPFWHWVIRQQGLAWMRPLLETVLAGNRPVGPELRENDPVPAASGPPEAELVEAVQGLDGANASD